MTTNMPPLPVPSDVLGEIFSEQWWENMTQKVEKIQEKLLMLAISVKSDAQDSGRNPYSKAAAQKLKEYSDNFMPLRNWIMQAAELKRDHVSLDELNRLKKINRIMLDAINASKPLDVVDKTFSPSYSQRSYSTNTRDNYGYHARQQAGINILAIYRSSKEIFSSLEEAEKLLYPW